jgi:GH15 family glucan-1,4-alpha-glucosidase
MKRRGCGDWLPAAGGPAARRRDRGDSSLPGDEGSFLACSFWLADAISGIGLVEEATSLYQRLLGLRNDVGLLSEEYDTVTGRHVGNTPQAFSMVGLINTARQLARVHTETSARKHEQCLEGQSTARAG